MFAESSLEIQCWQPLVNRVVSCSTVACLFARMHLCSHRSSLLCMDPWCTPFGTSSFNSAIFLCTIYFYYGVMQTIYKIIHLGNASTIGPKTNNWTSKINFSISALLQRWQCFQIPQAFYICSTAMCYHQSSVISYFTLTLNGDSSPINMTGLCI